MMSYADDCGVGKKLNTHTHDLLESLECSTRAIARLAKGLEQGRNSLVDRLVADVLLKNVEGLGSRSPDLCVVVDEGDPHDGDDFVFAIFSLCVGRVRTEDKKSDISWVIGGNLTYTSSLSARQTPCRIDGSVDEALARRMPMTSVRTFSPDLRQSSPMVREAVYEESVFCATCTL
jgi:hypothetical protein